MNDNDRELLRFVFSAFCAMVATLLFWAAVGITYFVMASPSSNPMLGAATLVLPAFMGIGSTTLFHTVRQPWR